MMRNPFSVFSHLQYKTNPFSSSLPSPPYFRVERPPLPLPASAASSLSPAVLAKVLWLLAGHAPVVGLYAGLVVAQGRLVEDRQPLHRLRGQGL